MALPKEITSSSTTLAIFSDGLSGREEVLSRQPAGKDGPAQSLKS